MQLKEEPFEREVKRHYVDMLNGCICRICVSDNPLEIVRMLVFANDYLAMLAQSRMLQISKNPQ